MIVQKTELPSAEREEPEWLSRERTAPYYMVIRARAMLMAAKAMENRVIGEKLEEARQIVSHGRKRLYEEGLGGSEDRKRKGFSVVNH